MRKKCKFCPTTLKTNLDYLKHIENMHKENKKLYFMCSVCGKQYKTKNELNHHINSKCGTLKKFQCKVCSQELMSAGSLYNHMLRHNGDRSFMCRFCAKLFFTAGQLKVHERIHTQDKAYVCEICNKGFCHRQSLITHSTLHTGIKPFQCESCGQSFSCVGNLIKHRKTHKDTCGLIPLVTHRVQHPSTKIKVKINTPDNCRLKNKEKHKELQHEVEKIKTELEEAPIEVPVKEASLSDSKHEANDAVKEEENKTDPVVNNREKKRRKLNKKGETEAGSCPICSKRYTNAHWLTKHLETHEPNPTNEAPPGLKCSCCKQKFNTKDELSAHQQSEHADILTCHECEKLFSNRDSLRSHQRVFHAGVTRKTYTYVCDQCGKQFKQKSHLSCHVARNCNEDPSYECGTCKKKFASAHTRNSHMRLHDPEKKLLCKFCGKSFHWKGQLKIHERSHTGEKPFTCLYCPKAFAYRESLITHSTIHTGIKPHLCEGCGSRFSCIGNLIKHRTTHANECGAWAYKNQNTST